MTFDLKNLKLKLTLNEYVQQSQVPIKYSSIWDIKIPLP